MTHWPRWYWSDSELVFECVTCYIVFFYITLLAHRSAIKADPPSQENCNTLAWLFIVFSFLMQIMISLLSFRAYWYTFFSYGFVISKTASKPARANRFVYVSRICTIPTSSFWWNFCKSCMCYGFLYFVRFPSLIAIVFIFYLLVIFPSQTRIRVNIKVVRCLKYSASLVSTQSVLRRNSDNKNYLAVPSHTTHVGADA